MLGHAQQERSHFDGLLCRLYLQRHIAPPQDKQSPLLASIWALAERLQQWKPLSAHFAQN